MYKRLNPRRSNHFKVVIIVVGTLLLSFYIYYCIYQYLFVKNHFDPFDGTEGRTCPACFGNSACFEFYAGEINIKGVYRIPIMQKFRTRHIYESYRGLFNRKSDVILKKLVTSHESATIDQNICDSTKYFNLYGKCNTKDALWDMIDQHPTKVLQIGHVEQTKVTSPMVHCLTERLFDRIKLRMKERASKNIEMPLLRRDEILLMYLLNVNQHSLVMQVFPAEDNWPFPKYYGACGRWIVEEHAGQPLNDFCNSYSHTKTQILLNLVKLPSQLDHSSAKNSEYDEFVLYIGDPELENFVVHPKTMKVTLVDLEHILVVDTAYLRKLKMPQSTQLLSTSANQLCDQSPLNCTHNQLAVHRDQLCAHIRSDYNQIVMCTVLAQLKNCLISNDDQKLTNLIQQCIYQDSTRLETYYKIKQLLEQRLQQDL